MSNSWQIFPVLPSEGTVNTINELNVDNTTCKYEALRLQFILTGEKEFNERDILKTIALYLKSDICIDKMVDYDGTVFNFVSNNGDNEFTKQKRLYSLYDDFINKCMDVMINNMQLLLDVTPTNTEENILIRGRLVMKMSKLNELKVYYLNHQNALNIMEALKYYL